MINSKIQVTTQEKLEFITKNKSYYPIDVCFNYINGVLIQNDRGFNQYYPNKAFKINDCSNEKII